uniref:DUF7378 domain-containing protein n=1 Tax=Oryza barthii TaxID=65489 RepID=A0A0D3EK40_9ORYZ
MSLKLLPWTAAPAPTPTVGEMTAKAAIHRAVLWFVAFYYPSIPFIGFGGIAYMFCFCAMPDDTFSGCVRRRDLWRLTPLLLCAAYMSLLALVSMHTRLFLPRAPNAVLTDLLDVGTVRVGIPLAWLACVGTGAGFTFAIALDCVFVVLIARVLAIWSRLVRTAPVDGGACTDADGRRDDRQDGHTPCRAVVSGRLLPIYPIFTTSGAAYALCTALQYPTFSGCVRRDLWRLTTLTLWAAYMSLLALVSMHMRLLLPRAPDAVLTDLLDVGAARIGIPLAFLACLAASLGVTRVAIALDCVFVVLIANVLAIWSRLFETAPMNGGACTDADGRRDDRQGGHIPRAMLWFVAVYSPSVPFICFGGHARGRPNNNLLQLRPPRPVEADASHAVGGYMSLLMLRAPYAVLKDLLDVGVKRIGIATVLVFLSCLGLSFGVTWVAIALDCVYLVIIAHVLAIWVRLVRTYAVRD